MVAEDLAGRGITDPGVLDAMGAVPRELFVPSQLAALAYADGPLPIGEGQTISQPYIVAVMIEAAGISPSSRVLEVGTGSGYAAAVMAHIARDVYTIERDAVLARAAADRLAQAGLGNVRVREADGSEGWPEAAPFDAIVVAAAAPKIPRPLKAQLAPGGRLVIPVGRTRRHQRLVRVRREPGGDREDDLGLVAFVPLIGTHGWGK